VSIEGGEETLFFPGPRDLAPRKAMSSSNAAQLEYLRAIANRTGTCNLPEQLKGVVASFAPPSKAPLPEWVDGGFLTRYLTGQDLATPERPSLWDTDHRIGVALEDATHAAATGQLFAAEHLRLRKDIRLRFSVSDRSNHKSGNGLERGVDVASLRQGLLQLGGEQRFGLIVEATQPLALPQVPISSPMLKWMLITPAIFVHGWRPGWIAEDGSVALRIKPDGFDKRAHRRSRREDAADYDRDKYTGAKISATLVAACLGKALPVGGWELLHEADGKVTGGGKPSRLAVPAGSVFYFRCDSVEDAQGLANALQGPHGRCRSDFFGEKGLGLGVCGTWAHQDSTSADVSKTDNA
jgi:CRISPR-associated protein Cmr3